MTISHQRLMAEAAATGFRPEILEKVIHLLNLLENFRAHPFLKNRCALNGEVHRKVGEWFDDPEVYEFIQKIMPVVSMISMRHYCKGAQLRRAGLTDWRTSLLRMVIPDAREASLIAAQHDPNLRSEEDRVQHFIALTKCSRATYFRIKSKLAKPQ